MGIVETVYRLAKINEYQAIHGREMAAQVKIGVFIFMFRDVLSDVEYYYLWHLFGIQNFNGALFNIGHLMTIDEINHYFSGTNNATSITYLSLLQNSDPSYMKTPHLNRCILVPNIICGEMDYEHDTLNSYAILRQDKWIQPSDKVIEEFIERYDRCHETFKKAFISMVINGGSTNQLMKLWPFLKMNCTFKYLEMLEYNSIVIANPFRFIDRDIYDPCAKSMRRYLHYETRYGGIVYRTFMMWAHGCLKFVDLRMTTEDYYAIRMLRGNQKHVLFPGAHKRFFEILIRVPSYHLQIMLISAIFGAPILDCSRTFDFSSDMQKKLAIDLIMMSR